jgi:hypothetical protein
MYTRMHTYGCAYLPIHMQARVCILTTQAQVCMLTYTYASTYYVYIREHILRIHMQAFRAKKTGHDTILDHWHVHAHDLDETLHNSDTKTCMHTRNNNDTHTLTYIHAQTHRATTMKPSVQTPKSLMTESPSYPATNLALRCFSIRYVCACICVYQICMHVCYFSMDSARRCLPWHPRQKQNIQFVSATYNSPQQQTSFVLGKYAVH